MTINVIIKEEPRRTRLVCAGRIGKYTVFRAGLENQLPSPGTNLDGKRVAGVPLKERL